MKEIISNIALVELSVDELININGGGFSDGFKSGHDAAKPVHDWLSGLGILVLLASCF